jgi:ribose 5-phosphate isomerase B
MKIGISSDHGGYELKEIINVLLSSLGHDVVDFGPDHLDNNDDYPDYVIPMAKAVAAGTIERGIAICGSGVGACIAANKVHGARAALIGDHFSAHQGVEDDNMNIMCLGGRITGYAVAQELVAVFLKAEFTGLERHNRRIAKVKELDK